MVAIPAIVKRSIDEVQFQVRKVSDFLQRDNFLRRRRIDGVSLGTSATSVRHALGYEPEGYIIIRKSASAIIYDTAINSEEITLIASASCTVSILVW